MKFVDDLMSKFKKPDDAELNRLNRLKSAVKPVQEEHHDLRDNTPLGSVRPARSTTSKSITRLRAFVHKKSAEEVAAEDAARVHANEEFTERALEDKRNADGHWTVQE